MADLPTVAESEAYCAHLEQLARDCAGLHDWAWIALLMREAASVPHPYPICAYVTGTTTGLMSANDTHASEMDYLWYLLGDWYELGSDGDAVEAESWMRAAAQEWLALPEDPHSRSEYLHRWNKKIEASGVSHAAPNPEMDRLIQRIRDDELAAWPQMKSRFPLGARVRGMVFARQPGCVFVRLEDDAIAVSAVGVIETSDLPSTPGADRAYPHAGTEISGTVVEHRDRDRQIRLVAADQ